MLTYRRQYMFLFNFKINIMELKELVKDYLSSEGYKCEVDEDGDLHFKYEGHHFFFCNNGDDEQFFRIIMPNIYDLEDNRTRVLEAINKVTSEMKVLKSFLVEDHLWLSIEMFVSSTPNVEEYIVRCLDIMMEARKRIAAEIFD